MHINFPFKISSSGRSANTDYDNHIRQLIEQLLFTIPGERVNRPDLGSALSQLVFAPNGDVIATTTEFLIQGTLQSWLGEFVRLESVQVSSENSTLTVTVQYTIIQTQQRQTTQFSTSFPSQ